MKTKATHGGKREGSGRKWLGKKRYNFTLVKENVEAAKKLEGNLSGLLDRLLAKWLKSRT